MSRPGDDADLEQSILDDLAVRRLAGDGLVRYSRRGPTQLDQAKMEALRRLERRVRKAELDAEPRSAKDA